jgi:hypothetical protein
MQRLGKSLEAIHRLEQGLFIPGSRYRRPAIGCGLEETGGPQVVAVLAGKAVVTDQRSGTPP